MTSNLEDGMCAVREEIIEDEASGLTLKFEQDEAGTTRLRIQGDQAFGDREIFIDADGHEAGEGNALTPLCCPSWLREGATAT
jgi:hypothetical protein